MVKNVALLVVLVLCFSSFNSTSSPASRFQRIMEKYQFTLVGEVISNTGQNKLISYCKFLNGNAMQVSVYFLNEIDFNFQISCSYEFPPDLALNVANDAVAALIATPEEIERYLPQPPLVKGDNQI